MVRASRKVRDIKLRKYRVLVIKTQSSVITCMGEIV